MYQIKIQKLLVTALFIGLFLIKGMAQGGRDTLNYTDSKKQKQGKWVHNIPEQRGNEGYEEEGQYKNDKKHGVWRLYTLNGDLIGVENYKNGGKDGLQQYYTFLGDLIKEENWRGYDPDAPYDTIPVYGQGNNEIIDFKIVKAEQYSVKHGEWKWYAADGSGRLIKTERYFRGALEKDSNPAAIAKATAKDEKKKEVPKTPEMLEWEKKNKGKKKVLRDGATSQ
jgi:antitoxin component YwqK of YwqJK toxin-antitoxin module